MIPWNSTIEFYRVTEGPMSSTSIDGNNGYFLVTRRNTQLVVIASDEMGWDHVSVSHQGRCPTWEEMCIVKELFFKPQEWVIQYHPAEEDYISRHPYVLHLWRPQNQDIPKPPPIMV